MKALEDGGLEHTGSFQSEAASEKPTILGVDGVKLGFVAYTDATNGFTPPHDWSLNDYPAADPKAGAKAIIHDARLRSRGRRRRGDRAARTGAMRTRRRRTPRRSRSRRS